MIFLFKGSNVGACSVEELCKLYDCGPLAHMQSTAAL